MPNLHQPESGISWHTGSPGEDILKVRWEYMVFLYHFSVDQTVRAGENFFRRNKNTYILYHMTSYLSIYK
jgi:hypothetical protein